MNEQAVVGQFQAVRMAPDNPLEWVRLAEILERTARECRQQARSLSEGLASVELLAIAVDLEPFRRAIQRQPGNAENWARLSKALDEAGDRRGSQACQRRANKLLGSARPIKGNEAQENTDPKQRLKMCPYCGKPIPVRLNRCDHCGGSWIHQSVVSQPLPTLEKAEPSKRPDATDHSSNQGFFYTVLAVVSAAIIYVFTVLVPAIIQAISKALGEFGKLLSTTWKAIQPMLLSSLRSMWRITTSIGKALWKFSGLFGLWLWKVIRWIVVAFFSVIKRILIGSGLMPIPLRLFYLITLILAPIFWFSLANGESSDFMGYVMIGFIVIGLIFDGVVRSIALGVFVFVTGIFFSSISDSARGCTAWVAMIVVLILLIAFALSIIALAASIILWLRSAWAIIKDAFTPAIDSSINTL